MGKAQKTALKWLIGGLILLSMTLILVVLNYMNTKTLPIEQPYIEVFWDDPIHSFNPMNSSLFIYPDAVYTVTRSPLQDSEEVEKVTRLTQSQFTQLQGVVESILTEDYSKEPLITYKEKYMSIKDMEPADNGVIWEFDIIPYNGAVSYRFNAKSHAGLPHGVSDGHL